jgi:hypothetical protein
MSSEKSKEPMKSTRPDELRTYPNMQEVSQKLGFAAFRIFG